MSASVAPTDPARQMRAARKPSQVRTYTAVLAKKSNRGGGVARAERGGERGKGRASRGEGRHGECGKVRKSHKERLAAQLIELPELTETFGEIAAGLQQALPAAAVGTKIEIGVSDMLSMFTNEAKAKFFAKNKFEFIGPDDCFSLCGYIAATTEDRVERLFFTLGAVIGLYSIAPVESLLKCQTLFAEMHSDVRRSFAQKFGDRFSYDSELSNLLDDIVAI